MASLLVVEDGTGIANANTYSEAADIRAYALLRGVILAPTDDAGDLLVDQMAIKAMDYLESFSEQFYGWQTYENQALAFPREGVPGPRRGGTVDVANGYENIQTLDFRPYLPGNVIPQRIKDAQAQLVMQVKAGIDLMPTMAGGTAARTVIREKLGPIETQYSDAVASYTMPQMPAVQALLVPFIKPSGVTRAYRG